jgi:hypothetical protein
MAVVQAGQGINDGPSWTTWLLPLAALTFKRQPVEFRHS